MFRVKATLAHPTEPSRAREVSLLVDTGATFTWIPEEVAAGLGLDRVGSRSVRLADGRVVERPLTQAVITLNGEQLTTPCLVGDPGSDFLLGAITLESFSLAADPVNRRLVPVIQPQAACC